jgi:hypothetical protein
MDHLKYIDTQLSRRTLQVIMLPVEQESPYRLIYPYDWSNAALNPSHFAIVIE